MLNYSIIGDDLQAVICQLEPQQSVMAEPGAMLYMQAGIKLETSLGGPADASLVDRVFGAGKRLLTGESLFINRFTNESHAPQEVAFAAPYPGKLIPLWLDSGQELLCQKDSFLCATEAVSIDIAFTKKLGAGLLGGEGFILQKLSGRGEVFLHAGGSICQRTLGAGETLKVDTGCIVAFQSSVSYDIQLVKGIKNMFFGGEGLFYALLEGPGVVYLQTLPFSRLANRIIASAPALGGSRRDEGSVLGRIGDMIGGE